MNNYIKVSGVNTDPLTGARRRFEAVYTFDERDPFSVNVAGVAASEARQWAKEAHGIDAVTSVYKSGVFDYPLIGVFVDSDEAELTEAF
jgi:DUF2075 family protein